MMAKEKKALSEKEIGSKVKDLKIELLKTPTKRARIKKEIARLLTMAQKLEAGREKLDGKNTKTKSVEEKK